MAVETPRISAADASAAVQVQTTSPSVVPEVVSKVTDTALSLNKERKLTDLRESLTQARAEFETSVLGPDAVVQTEATKQALQDFNSETSRLARAKASLGPTRFKSNTEKILRQHIARAPGLETEFKAIARNSLGFDPTGAGLEESFAFLRAQQQSSASVRDRFVQAVSESGGDDLVVRADAGLMTDSDFFIQGTALVDARSRGERGKIALDEIKTAEEASTISAKNFANDYIATEAINYDFNLRNTLTPEALAEYNSLKKGEINSLSQETLLEVQQFKTNKLNEVNARVGRVDARLSKEERDAMRVYLNNSVATIDGLVTGKVTGEVAETSMANSRNLSMLEVSGNPELVASLNTFSIAAEYKIPETSLFQIGSKAAQDLFNLNSGLISIDTVRRTHSPEKSKTVESIYHALHTAMANKGIELTEPDLSQPVEAYIKDMAQNLVTSPDIDTAVRSLETIASATYLNLMDTLPDKDQVQQQYEAEMSELGANTLGVILQPLQQRIQEGDIQLSISNGVLSLPAQAETTRRRSTALSATAKQKRLINKYNRIATAYAKILGVPKEEFIRASFNKYIVQVPEVEQQIQELLDLEPVQGAGRSAVGERIRRERELKELEARRDRLVQLLGDTDD